MVLSSAEYLIGLPRSVKRAIALVVDILACFASVQLAFFLRLGEWQAIDERPLHSTVVTIVLAIPLFITHGLYRAIFRYSALSAIQVIARAVLLFSIPFVVIFTFVGVPGTPRTIGIIEPILLFLCTAGTRAFANWWLGSTYRQELFENLRPRAIVYGTGDAGRQIAATIRQTREFRLVGFVDEALTFRGSTIAGIPVYSPEKLTSMVQDRLVDEVLLVAPGMSRTRRMELVDSLTQEGVKVRMLPAIMDIVQGKISVSDLKHVAIEDLLSRQPAPPDEALLATCLRSRTVMVTGAGGSIGSELCRQVMASQPRRLVMVDASEYNLYAIEHELQALKARQDNQTELVALLGSVRDQRRMTEIFESERPETIYHAAAYKHVPLVETNPLEGLENNVLGTFNLVELAVKFGSEFFILISSDKAVRPTNVMGASKRMAELIVQAHAALSAGRRYSMVRFGNVLGSSGSVVPLFRAQIAAGGPITITHPDVTRYFMTIPEAAQLVIQAGAMARGGEVFVLDMGRPVRIVDLARNMIHLSGLTVRDEENHDGDISLEFVGLRPGEKLFEELLIGDNPEPSTHPNIMKAQEHHLDWNDLLGLIEELQVAVKVRDPARALDVLQRAVPEYCANNDEFNEQKTGRNSQ